MQLFVLCAINMLQTTKYFDQVFCTIYALKCGKIMAVVHLTHCCAFGCYFQVLSVHLAGSVWMYLMIMQDFLVSFHSFLLFEV